MSTLTLDISVSGLVALANALAVTPILADDAQERVLSKAQRDVVALMVERADVHTNPTALVHVVSGALRDSLTPETPVRRGRGTQEGLIRAGVPYADDEVSKGGEHDFPARTVGAIGPILDAAALSAAGLIVDVLEGAF